MNRTVPGFGIHRDTISSILRWNAPLITAMVICGAAAFGLLIARLPLLDATMLVVLTIGGVAALIEPIAGLGVGLFLGLFRAYLQTEVPQVPSQIGQVFVALALVSWLARGLSQRSIRIHKSPTLFALLLFVCTALLSLWKAVNAQNFGLMELIKWGQIVAVFLVVRDCLDPRRCTWLLATLLVTGVFQAGIGIYEFGIRGDGPDHFAILGGDFYRAYGTFEQPNPFGGYMSMTACLGIGVVLALAPQLLTRLIGRQQDSSPPSDPRHANKLPVWGLIGVTLASITMVAALAMSWSRGAWLGFGAAAIVMAISLPRQARLGLLLAVCLIVAAVGLYTTGLLPASIEARLTSFIEDLRLDDVRGVGINHSNYAVIERLAHWQAALEMWRYNFWTGVGFGCYEPAYPDFALINWPFALGHAHNTYLTIAAETGTVGLLAYLMLWVTILWRTWQATRIARGLNRGIAIGLLGAWTHLSVHHMLDNLYVNNMHIQIGIMLGLLAVIHHSNRQHRADTAISKRAMFFQ